MWGWHRLRHQQSMKMGDINDGEIETVTNRLDVPVGSSGPLRPREPAMACQSVPPPSVSGSDGSRGTHYSCSVIVPARNEAGTIETVLRRVPEMGGGTEVIVVEGHSQDDTWAAVERARERDAGRIKAWKQRGGGKAGAVREGLMEATGDLLFILDADLSVRPEELTRFYDVMLSGAADFVNGTRLVFPMEPGAMRFLNEVGNRFFARAWTWLLGQPITDALCGTKVFWRQHYLAMRQDPRSLRALDPFGDFELLYGAARLHLRVVEVPVRYQRRTYGSTNIHRWHDGWLLLKMLSRIALNRSVIR